MVNEYFCLKQWARMSESLLTFTCYYVGVCEKLKYQKVSCVTICVGWLSIPREILIHVRMAMYLAICSLMLAVCLYQDLTKCLRPYGRFEHVQPEGRTREEKRASSLTSQTIYASISRVFSYELVAGRVKNERASYRNCRVYIGNHVTLPTPYIRFILCATKSNART